jgi:hypothetical protein
MTRRERRSRPQAMLSTGLARLGPPRENEVLPGKGAGMENGTRQMGGSAARVGRADSRCDTANPLGGTIGRVALARGWSRGPERRHQGGRKPPGAWPGRGARRAKELLGSVRAHGLRRNMTATVAPGFEHGEVVSDEQ